MTEPSAPGPADREQPLPPPSSEDSAPYRPPLGRRVLRTVGKAALWIPALIPAAIVVAIIWQLLSSSGMSLSPFRWPVTFGWGYFGSTWNPPFQWGIMVFIVGAFLVAVPALALSMLIGLGIAIASTTYLPKLLTRFLDPFVDLLAGIPSVVYGLWAYIVVAPVFGLTLNPWIYAHASGEIFGYHFAIPGLTGAPPPAIGTGLPLGIFVLTIMALPITTLLIRDALSAVPRDLWESGLALGATRWETVRRVAIPHGSRGILSAAFLGFGRAISETVALVLVLNVEPAYPINFYHGTATLATEMFDSIADAGRNVQWLAALSEMALVLLAISLVVNIVGRRLVSSFVAYDVAGV